TRMHGPVRLVYVEIQPDRSAAMRRERVLKALKHHQKKALITGKSPFPISFNPEEQGKVSSLPV
ncbi:MAG TPA: hypothetical protein VLH85_08650, partial [Levilinea sp.]|nr:hypothetical protein [Levilinea sp.]